jgi:hypothetical protein
VLLVLKDRKVKLVPLALLAHRVCKVSKEITVLLARKDLKVMTEFKDRLELKANKGFKV